MMNQNHNETVDKPCLLCSDITMTQCHKKRFSLYCIDAVEYEFRLSPLDTSVEKYAKVFTMAYNRALDFDKFQDHLKLMPHGYYYPPACMMAEFCEFMPLLEKDKEDYILGKVKFQQEIENRDIQEVESHELQERKARKVCEHCGQKGRNCHLDLFADYCYAHLYRIFMSYPNSITDETAKKVYIKWYNSALHFHTWETTHNYVRRLFVLPPKCLGRQMQFGIDTVMQKRDKHRTDGKKSELVDSNMNLFGTEIVE